MQIRDRFGRAFSGARRVLSRLFSNDDIKASRRRKRKRPRLEHRKREPAPGGKSAAAQSAPTRKSAAIAQWKPKESQPPDYEGDFLAVWYKNVEFLKDPRFLAAYQRGLNSGHQFGADVQLEWRAHVACWAATHAKQLPGDFVECGVNTGILSLTVCEYIDFNATGKNFWLFDTFDGIPESQISEGEAARARWENKRLYFDCWEVAQRNFASYPNARLIRGMVPETLPQAEIDKVCYLSIDMNIVAPERAAIAYFWPKLVTGAVVLLDDYGWRGFHEQKAAMDQFAALRGTEVLCLPTGQGLMVKI
jgi:O-methyltransferase